MEETRWGKLSTRISLMAGSTIAISFAVMIGLISWFSYRQDAEQGYQLALSQARNYANQAEGRFRASYTLPKHLADVVDGIKRTGVMPERKQVNSIHLALLDASPQSVGLWMLWEPNAFDNNDNAYRLAWPQQDPTGRYTPYVTRSAQGKAQIDVMMSPDRVKEFPKYKDHPQSYLPDYEKPGWGDFYYVPKQRNRDTITEPYAYDVQNAKVLESSLTVAIKDTGGRFIGLAGTDIMMNDLQTSFGQLHPDDTGFVTMVSEGGLYVVNPKASLLGQPVEKDSPLAAYLDKIKQGQPFVYESEGFTHFYQPVSIADTGQFWALGVSIPTAAITASAWHQCWLAIGIGLASLIVILLLLTTVVTSTTRPLNTMAKTMEQLASGGGDLSLRINIGNRDEIGRTASAFNQFMHALSTLFSEVRRQSLEVSQAAAHLADSAQQVEQASSVQSDAASATAAGVEEVTVSVHHIADTSREAESLASQTGKLTDQSMATVEQATGEIQKMSQNMNDLVRRINGLGARSEEVASIINVIKDIADQTNLLALNAAIEAARAGEMGRGFAVVADEVRKLAGRSAEATVQISRIVSSIGIETKDAVKDVSTGRERVDLSVQVAEEASNAMRRVLKCSQDLATSIAIIANATQEQSNASSEIAQNIERISNMAQSNGQVVHDVATQVARLRELSSTLERLVGNFKL